MTGQRLVDGATVVAAACAVVLTSLVVIREVGPSRTRTLVRPNIEVADWRSYVADGRWMGPEDAPVIILEFGDYECPACRGIQEEIEAALGAYPSEVALVYRHWPLSYHHLAYPAARAAECARQQGLFEEFHDWLYRDSEWMADPRGRFVAFADRLGVEDLSAFGACLDSLDPVEAVERDIAAAQMIGGTGTPTVLVNGTLLGSAADSATLSKLIEGALADRDGGG